MTKFSQNFKLMVVMEYLTSSIGMTNLAKKYGIKSHSLIPLWIDLYKKFGNEGLKLPSFSADHSGKFKLNVLNWMKTNNASFSETSIKFNIPSPSTIWQWQRKLEEQGYQALVKSRGRPVMAKKPTKKVLGKDDELKKLREQNELLQIENDYLKKLRALVQSEQDKKHK